MTEENDMDEMIEAENIFKAFARSGQYVSEGHIGKGDLLSAAYKLVFRTKALQRANDALGTENAKLYEQKIWLMEKAGFVAEKNDKFIRYEDFYIPPPAVSKTEESSE